MTTIATTIGRTDMNRSSCHSIAWTALVCGFLISPICDSAAAQEEPGDEAVSQELEVTMTLMPEGAELPDAVTRTIELPPAASASEHAADAAAPGLTTANEARANRQAGLDAVAEARERGREFGEEMAEQALQNREDAGRGDPPVTPPDGPPDDLPGPPDL